MRSNYPSVILVLSLLLPPSAGLTQQEPQQQPQKQEPQKPEEKTPPPEQKPGAPSNPPYIDPNKTGGAQQVRVSLQGTITLTSLHPGDQLTGKVDRAVQIGSQKIPKGARALIAVVADPDAQSLELRLLSLEFKGKTYKPDAGKGLALAEPVNTVGPGHIDPRIGITEGPMAGNHGETITIKKVSFEVRAASESKKPEQN
jgi:hypothetical protein